MRDDGPVLYNTKLTQTSTSPLEKNFLSPNFMANMANDVFTESRVRSEMEGPGVIKNKTIHLSESGEQTPCTEEIMEEERHDNFQIVRKHQKERRITRSQTKQLMNKEVNRLREAIYSSQDEQSSVSAGISQRMDEVGYLCGFKRANGNRNNWNKKENGAKKGNI
ncbi:hypothetical protein L2E82_22285 [Cichorium intybus]|uniref:Uncharacterized protein n=1 Tax=Cichorium intybus TaxID=13427 RepID=A0ACB9DXD6_CICIN|nr:hypothetical protein L2E82_22285 [Cichorium intybus]